MTTGGSLTGYAVSGNPYLASITAGNDNALWFAENTSGSGGGELGRITTGGSITIPTSSAFPSGITAGPDKAMWFTETDANKIGRVTTGLSANVHRPRRLERKTGR